jgi:hypothetical protein
MWAIHSGETIHPATDHEKLQKWWSLSVCKLLLKGTFEPIPRVAPHP